MLKWLKIYLWQRRKRRQEALYHRKWRDFLRAEGGVR